MDEFIKQLLAQSPNLIALVWIVYIQGKRLDKMIEQNQLMINKLLEKLDDPDES